MIIIPAIDLMDGRAVRLAEGDRDRVTVYSDTPWSLAQSFAQAGAKRIHVVDLDGAFAGFPAQIDLVRRLIDVAHGHGAQVEVGGGIRSADAIETLMHAGADYVVVGTLAVREPETTASVCKAHPGKIVVAIDAKDGTVAVDGWTRDSGIPAIELGRQAADWGAAALLHTDVARDGLQVGPAVEATAELARSLPIPVIASGGVSSLADLRALAEAGIEAVVFGRALYEGAFTVEEAVAQC